MDKLLDKLEKVIERHGVRAKKAIAMGLLEGEAGLDGHGPREAGKFAKPKIAQEGDWGDSDKLVKPRGCKSAY